LAILGGVRSRFFPPVAGGAKVIDEGRCLRVRLSSVRPAYIGAAASGGLVFLLIFIVGFGFGFNPPIEIMCVVWGIVLGGGLIASFYAHRKLSRGDSDLVIDDFRETVALPRTFGRQEEVIISAGKILAFEIEEVEKRDSEGGNLSSYIPSMILTNEDGSQRREKLIEWRDEASAKSLVEWLRKRFGLKTVSDTGETDERSAADWAS
jgi:hypothetical protein